MKEQDKRLQDFRGTDFNLSETEKDDTGTVSSRDWY